MLCSVLFFLAEFCHALLQWNIWWPVWQGLLPSPKHLELHLKHNSFPLVPLASFARGSSFPTFLNCSLVSPSYSHFAACSTPMCLAKISSSPCFTVHRFTLFNSVTRAKEPCLFLHLILWCYYFLVFLLLHFNPNKPHYSLKSI